MCSHQRPPPARIASRTPGYLPQERSALSAPLVKIAATADLHVRTQAEQLLLREAFHDLQAEADLLLIAGDLTEMGRVSEMELVAEILQELSIPSFVIFGNHDRRGMRRTALKKVLRRAGSVVLEGTGAIATLPGGATIGIAGVTGTGGGFAPHREEFGPGGRFTRAVMVRSRRESARLRKALKNLREQDPDITIVLSHFAPTSSTLGNEPPLKHWMLGNALLGRTIDEFLPDLVIHGHAHLGNEKGTTEAGISVLNVALPIVGGIRLLEIENNGQVTLQGIRDVNLPLLATRVRESDVR